MTSQLTTAQKLSVCKGALALLPNEEAYYTKSPGQYADAHGSPVSGASPSVARRSLLGAFMDAARAASPDELLSGFLAGDAVALFVEIAPGVADYRQLNYSQVQAALQAAVQQYGG